MSVCGPSSELLLSEVMAQWCLSLAPAAMLCHVFSLHQVLSHLKCNDLMSQASKEQFMGQSLDAQGEPLLQQLLHRAACARCNT